jgi:putative ABC transport system ATP-binding protein
MDLIKEMARTNHQTIVMVTHDRRLAEYADRIIHILDGKIENIEVVHKAESPIEALGQSGEVVDEVS